MRARGLRIVLTAWAVLLGLLCVTAAAKRGHEHRHLRQRLIAHLAPLAETGREQVDSYLYGYSWNSGTLSFPGSPQAQAVYLLHRGYGSPELRRSLLLCEARRCYDWCYLYTSVNNHDLRTALTMHCLRDFPDDARVHWAAGQLALAASDFEAAERELARTLELAGIYPAEDSHGGGVRGFCKDTGISQQHLRGRYACALTLLGKWDQADAQTARAEAAGDGAAAPPLASFDYHDDEWYRLNHPESYRKMQAEKAQEALRKAQEQREIDGYLRSRSPVALSRMLAELDDNLRLSREDEQNFDAAARAFELRGTLLRVYLLAHDWQAAEGLLADQSYTSSGWADPDQLRPLIGLLLTRLAAGEKLGRTAEENRAARLAELEAESGGQAERWWDWDLAYADCGELSGLLAADYLPFLLRTDGFADALAKSGRPLDEVLAEIRAVVQPQRDSYYDSRNGKLRWR